MNGKLAVRPPDVQNAQWQFVYDSAYVPKQPVASAPAAWIAEEGAAKLDGATLRLTPGAGGRAEARYGRRISDISTYSGYDSSTVLPVERTRLITRWARSSGTLR